MHFLFSYPSHFLEIVDYIINIMGLAHLSFLWGMYSVRFSESRTPSLSARILHEKHIEVQSRSPSTAPPRSPSLPEGGKGFVQISIFLQRISFVSIIMHNKIGIFYLNQFALTMEFWQTFSIKYSYLLFIG